eukprot:GILI01004069.1.p1 GENE.GILI01004069.1~~GILI01004069.1.p1  ORF type:complete len:414 (+),score=89.56 GILI01004069.1:87-1328(+)
MSNANVSNMYDRVGNWGGHLDKRTPGSFSALVLPSKQELRVLGLTDSASMWGWNRDHPYGKWETHPFPKGTSTQEALGRIETFNTGNDRVVKVRITFTDGTHISLQRKTPSKPDTLKAVGTYDPNAAFHTKTEGLATVSRTDQLKRTKPIVNEKGHLATRRANSSSSFSPQKLFADCPINDPPQVSFNFTPVGFNSFMVRPNYRIPGCRPQIANYSETAYSYRPRGFGNSEFPNHEEITGRNEVTKPRSERAGEHIYTGSFLRKTQGKGAPLSPSFMRNTASGSLNNTYHNSIEARRSIARAHSASVARSQNARNYENHESYSPASASSKPKSPVATNKKAAAVRPLSADAANSPQHYADDVDNVLHQTYNSNNNSPSRVVLSPGGKVRVHYADHKSTDHFDEEAPPTPVLAD